MLKSLYINNFAVIETLELDFSSGFSALTGETGAGKSIIIDAIGLVLGDRADTNLIRTDKTSAEIILLMDLNHLSSAREWLEQNDFEQESECILRRVIRNDGKSRAYINGTPVPLKLLKEFGERIINIYGQHAHQLLMHASTQRELLDKFAGHQEKLNQLADIFTQWSKQTEQYQQLYKNSSELESKIELLRYQVEELDLLDLQANEAEQLEAVHKKLANVEELKKSSLAASHQLMNDEGADTYSNLNQVCHQIQNLLGNDQSLNKTHQNLEEALTLVNDAATELRHYAESIEIDPEALVRTEERMASIDEISRKHKVTPNEITHLHQQLSDELKKLTQPDFDLDYLLEQIKKTEHDYQKLAQSISKKRKSVAKQLSANITLALSKLGMEKATLEVAVKNSMKESFTRYGLDNICINVQTNPGSKKLPLSQVASGGELSRISLAIQMIAADSLQVPVLIFDEVDSGVGGAVAEVIGKELRNIGDSRQVICITHLPQVAANAHHHYRVNKQSDNDDTASAIENLEHSERINEIARMLGGVTLTENAYLHAQEMLEAGIQ
ncbi:MAG: DNA repair protein RecN [Pseudomonadota bacterium]